MFYALDHEMDTDKDEFGLTDELKELPLHVLFIGTRKKIALFLDIQIDSLHPENGLLCDYRGVAECIGFGQLEIKSFERQESPTLELLSKWESNLDSKPSFGNLLKILKYLGRYDVLKGCMAKIESDGRSYLEQQKRLEADYKPKQDGTVSSSSEEHYVDERGILTLSDVTNPGTVVVYDAYISYNNGSGRDQEFVQECIRHLETHEHGLKLLIPERDILVGGAKYIMDAELIKSRCKRMVIVLSHDYIHSADCDFRLKFAHSLAPGARQKRLIPVIIDEQIMVPDILRHVTVCDYTKLDLKDWFWPRLASSLKAPIETEDISEYSTLQQHIPLSMQSSISSPKKQKREKKTWSLFSSRERSSNSSDNSSNSCSSISSVCSVGNMIEARYSESDTPVTHPLQHTNSSTTKLHSAKTVPYPTFKRKNIIHKIRSALGKK